ncbi:glycosyltransferase [Azospirillum argentinense]
MPPSLIHLDPGPPPHAATHHDLVWAFSGWACREGCRLRAADLRVGDARFPADTGAVRLDAEAAQLRHGLAPAVLDCGFWGVAVLPAGGSWHSLQPVMLLEWSDGTREEWPARAFAGPGPSSGAIVDTSADRKPAEDIPLVAIAMATYQPDPPLFQAQIASIRNQTHGRWVCLIEDDGSDDAHWAVITAAIAGDARFLARRNTTNLGFYHNFERALTRVPAEAAFVALADQDDRWAPEKLSVLVGVLAGRPDAMLAFSNMTVVDRNGRLLSETFWPGLDSRHDNLDALLMANVVTGCACLFRASLLQLALPFPALGRLAYHDHWIACCATVAGGIAYESRALAGYVQHGGNSLGYRRRPGLRLASRIAACLLLSPAIALAGQSAMVRRRLSQPLKLLVSLPDTELVCRTAFAETLRRRATLDDDGRRAVSTFAPGPRIGLRLLAALLRPDRRGKAFRGVAARLFTGRVIARLMSLLARLRPPPAAGRTVTGERGHAG